MLILDFLKTLGSLIKSAILFAHQRGLTDALIQRALPLIRQAEVEFFDNTTRREWVVGKLVALGVNEHIARLAVEIAVALHKKSLAVPKEPPVA